MNHTIRTAATLLTLATASSVAAQEDAAQIGARIEALASQGGRDAVAQIVARIEQGLPPALVTQAVAALGRMRDREAVNALLTLGTHRRGAVRAQVAESLGRRGDVRARPVLADLIDDPEPRVRSAAVLALGLLGAQDTMDTVILAAARGVSEAAIVVGQQAGPADVVRLLRRVTIPTLAALAPALRVLLERDNLVLRSKQAIVAHLGQIRDPESERILREVGAALAANHPLRGPIDEALSRVTAQEGSQ